MNKGNNLSEKSTVTENVFQFDEESDIKYIDESSESSDGNLDSCNESDLETFSSEENINSTDNSVESISNLSKDNNSSDSSNIDKLDEYTGNINDNCEFTNTGESGEKYGYNCKNDNATETLINKLKENNTSSNSKINEDNYEFTNTEESCEDFGCNCKSNNTTEKESHTSANSKINEDFYYFEKSYDEFIEQIAKNKNNLNLKCNCSEKKSKDDNSLIENQQKSFKKENLEEQVPEKTSPVELSNGNIISAEEISRVKNIELKSYVKGDPEPNQIQNLNSEETITEVNQQTEKITEKTNETTSTDGDDLTRHIEEGHEPSQNQNPNSEVSEYKSESIYIKDDLTDSDSNQLVTDNEKSDGSLIEEMITENIQDTEKIIKKTTETTSTDGDAQTLNKQTTQTKINKRIHTKLNQKIKKYKKKLEEKFKKL